MEFKDYPLEEIAKEADKILKTYPGTTVFQKFTCQNCGSRQTMDEPNTFYTSGKCEECGYVTNITQGNYLVVSTL